MARIAPSLIGSSYCLPVRLSVTVSVSPIDLAGVAEAAAFLSVVTLFAMVLVLILIVVGGRHPFTGYAIAAVRPSRQILVTASLAAEGTPLWIHRTRAAQHAERRVAHPVNDNSGFGLRATDSGPLQLQPKAFSLLKPEV